MNKLFAPLNEQIEVIRIKKTPINETEIINTTNNIIFSNKINKLNEGMFFNKIHWPKEIKIEYDSYNNLYDKYYSVSTNFARYFDSADCKSCKAKNTKSDFVSSRCISSCKNKEALEKASKSRAKIYKELKDKEKKLALMIYNYCMKKKVKLRKFDEKATYSFNEIITDPNDYGQITWLIELIDNKGIYVIK